MHNLLNEVLIIYTALKHINILQYAILAMLLLFILPLFGIFSILFTPANKVDRIRFYAFFFSITQFWLRLNFSSYGHFQ
jgi:hypothetical protein